MRASGLPSRVFLSLLLLGAFGCFGCGRIPPIRLLPPAEKYRKTAAAPAPAAPAQAEPAAPPPAAPPPPPPSPPPLAVERTAAPPPATIVAPEPTPVVAPEPEPSPTPIVAPEPETSPTPVVAQEPETSPTPVVAPEPEPLPTPVVAQEPEPTTPVVIPAPEPAPVVARAPEPPPPPPPVVPPPPPVVPPRSPTQLDPEQVARGREVYLSYCSSCHGDEGHGDGPLGASLLLPPPDLTRIAERRGGSFRPGEVAGHVDGRFENHGHGTAGEPIWGRPLTRSPASPSPEVATLLAYLESIQRSGERPDGV